MQINSAIFERGATDLSNCPDESRPEFAFIGRSNVGKSSLLNFLAGEQGLARVSPKPGFTRQLNFFIINNDWRLVDLPGYGFAHGAQRDRTNFNKAVLNYLERRPNLRCIFALIESGLPPQAIDIEFIEWLVLHRVPFVLVFTKTDKSSATNIEAQKTAFFESIGAWFAKPPVAFECSAELRTGRRELLEVIDLSLKESADTLPDPTQTKPRPAPAKHRPDLKRPW